MSEAELDLEAIANQEQAERETAEADRVIEDLRKHRIDSDEILRVYPQLQNAATTRILGKGFTATRNLEHGFDVEYDDHQQAA